MVVISHATEDNEFTRWLALQLARHGYHPWCDLTKLLGGETFWREIERVLRYRAAKFIYVLSRASNNGAGRGFWKELDLADSEARHNGIEDFIIPVGIDDLPSSEYNIYLHTRNAVPFHPHWSEGLGKLLAKLRRDRVPRRAQSFNARTVTKWWRRFYSASVGIRRKPEDYASSWFPIEQLPTKLYLHSLQAASDGDSAVCTDLPRPAIRDGQRLVAFAPASDFESHLAPSTTITSSDEIKVADILAGALDSGPPDIHTARRFLVWLLRESWDQWLRGQPVGIYELTRNARCAFFFRPQDDDTLWARFTAPDGSSQRRGLTGYWSWHSKAEPDAEKKHHWHYAVQARPKLSPRPLYHLSGHVIFTDDGKTPWVSKPRMHSARRRQCKNWYNDEWRDRLLAAVNYLAGGNPLIEIPVSSQERITIAIHPLTFSSELSYTVLPKFAEPLESEAEAPEGWQEEENEQEEDVDGASGGEGEF